MSTVQPAGILPDVELPSGLTAFFEVVSSEGFWKRLGVGALGTALVIVGLVVLISGTRAVKQVASLATSVVSKGVIK
jgi:hypothetical protein